MVCPVFHFIWGNLMKVKVKVKSSSAYDCCRKNIYIFRIIRGTGMWYIGIPIKKGVLKVKGKIGPFPAPVNLKQAGRIFKHTVCAEYNPQGKIMFWRFSFTSGFASSLIR